MFAFYELHTSQSSQWQTEGPALHMAAAEGEDAAISFSWQHLGVSLLLSLSSEDRVPTNRAVCMLHTHTSQQFFESEL